MTRIHGAIYVGVVFELGALILHQAVALTPFHPLIALLEVDAVAGFVAERPNDDGGVVLGAFIHAFAAVEMGRHPGGVLGQRLLAVTHAVRFYVGLVYYVKAILVAQLIPTAGLRIVAVAHRVDVVLLHYLYIFEHQLFAHIVTCQRRVLVAVGALYLYGLAVHQHDTIFKLDAPEAHVRCRQLGHLVVVFVNER